jgi:hypothetical protein
VSRVRLTSSVLLPSRRFAPCGRRSKQQRRTPTTLSSLRLAELETLCSLGPSANARIHIVFDKHARKGAGPVSELWATDESKPAEDE